MQFVVLIKTFPTSKNFTLKLLLIEAPGREKGGTYLHHGKKVEGEGGGGVGRTKACIRKE